MMREFVSLRLRATYRQQYDDKKQREKPIFHRPPLIVSVHVGYGIPYPLYHDIDG